MSNKKDKKQNKKNKRYTPEPKSWVEMTAEHLALREDIIIGGIATS